MFLSDTTTDAFVAVFNFTDTGDGVIFIGGIKNTGGLNSMTVKLTVTDKWGTTDNTSYVVLLGTKLSFDTLLTAISTAQPPYASVKIEVKSTVGGASTTFDLYTVLR